MKLDWLGRLYEYELKMLDKKVREFQKLIENRSPDITENRLRDYKIYKACVHTAYTNDDLLNQSRKITFEEQTVLNTLAQELELSNEEMRLINYMIIPMQKLGIDEIISELKTLGFAFYSRKTNTIYVADEMVRMMRRIRGKEVADKFFRRVLRHIREPQINLICRKHNIDWKIKLEEKIKRIIKEGISFSSVLQNEAYKDGTNLTGKKKFINELSDRLNISSNLKGVTIEEKISNLIQHFDEIEKDERVGISIDGYEKMLIDIGSTLPKTSNILKNEFELQEENILSSDYLLSYNIKPIDVIEIISDDDLNKFCSKHQIKTRGNLISNILENYKDADNLYMENYVNVGFRDLAALKENGIKIKDVELGILFEDLTKKIFSGLGFNVDEKLRKRLNTKSDKMDILLNLGNDDLIIIECKSVKESGYNKFSSVSRQLKSYIQLATKNNFKVIKSLLIAPDFSDDFIKDCGLDYDLNLSLITASSLLRILEGFKESKHKQFPHNLLMRDVLIQEERVIKAIGK
ncbi:MAG: hypothetical protein O2951_10065 [Bacteroidetes bacterium]|nr:hypothetical protein [Bacteroidota bacterium]